MGARSAITCSFAIVHIVSAVVPSPSPLFNCTFAPLYASKYTAAAIGITKLGTAFFAMRDPGYLFTRRDHLDFGNWSLAFGIVAGDSINMIEGFEGPGVLAWDDNACKIAWPRAKDEWIPLDPMTDGTYDMQLLSPNSYAVAYEKAISDSDL